MDRSILLQRINALEHELASLARTAKTLKRRKELAKTIAELDRELLAQELEWVAPRTAYDNLWEPDAPKTPGRPVKAPQRPVAQPEPIILPFRPPERDSVWWSRVCDARDRRELNRRK